MPLKHSVSLILPVFQEEEIIEKALVVSDEYLSKNATRYEIIVVNDGSKDKTGELADNYARNNPRIKVIHNICNLGSGKSVFTGLKAAQYDLLLANFADLPFDIKELDKIECILDENVDFVVVVREDRSANTFYRKSTSLVNYWLIRLFFGVNVSDFQFVQVYKKHVIDTIQIESRGTFVAPEIIIRAKQKGFVCKEYKTDFHPRLGGRAKCGKHTVILQTIYEMFRFWFKWKLLHMRS